VLTVGQRRFARRRNVAPLASGDVNKRLTLLSLCLGPFLAQTDTTAVNLALPAIGADMRGTFADLQ
jgi:hypothetical protein